MFFIALLFALVAALVPADDIREQMVRVKKPLGDWPPIILPSPKRATWGSERFLADQLTRVLFTGEASGNEVNARRLKELLISRWRLDLKVERTASSLERPVNAIIFTSLKSRMARELAARAPQETAGEEGYAISANKEGVIIAANGRMGGFYAIQTLLHVITGRDKALSVPQMTVFDWPDKSFRGVHLMMPGRTDLAFYRRLIDLLAEFKYNRLIIEVGGGLEYRKHPEINRAWEEYIAKVLSLPGKGVGVQQSQGYEKNSIHYALGGGSFITQQEARELIEYAQAREFEVIPEVPSLSHSDYLLQAHRELAERADDPFPDTYCPSDPRTYKLLFDVMDEVIEVFKPKRVNIGHDEYYSIGVDERCRGKKPAELFAGDITKIHDYLSARNIQTMMWGEKLLNITTTDGKRYGGIERVTWDTKRNKVWVIPPTFEAVDRVPKDILILDWYWELGPYTQDFYREHGFRSIFGNFDASKFGFWAERSGSPNLQGGVASNWTVTKEYGFGHDGRIHNLVFSSELFWNRSYDASKKMELYGLIAELMPVVRQRLSGVDYPSLLEGEKQFVTLDLKAAANLPIRGEVKELGRYDFSVLSSGEQKLGTTPFKIINAAANNANSVVALGFDREKETKRLEVNANLSSLVFLHACLTNKKRPPILEALTNPEVELIGEYAINYQDGSREKVPLRFTVNIQSLSEPEARPYFTDAVFRWEVKSESPWGTPQHYSLSSYEWINPHPEKNIQSIEVRYVPGMDQSEIFLFAVTGVQAPPPGERMRALIAERQRYLTIGAEDERITKH
jgi:hypothetical protein